MGTIELARQTPKEARLPLAEHSAVWVNEIELMTALLMLLSHSKRCLAGETKSRSALRLVLRDLKGRVSRIAANCLSQSRNCTMQEAKLFTEVHCLNLAIFTISGMKQCLT